MKTVLKLLLIYCLSAIVYQPALAQQDESKENAANNHELVLPTLIDLIDSAIKHSAMVKYRNLDIVAKESALKMQRNSWLRNMGVQGDTRYGNADAFSTNTNGVANTLSNITTKQWNYSVGVYFKIPVFDVVSRKSLINQSNAELEQSKTMVEVQQDEIRQLVIKQYEELLLKQRLLKIRSQSMGSATVNMEMVEREFKNGIIPVTEYVRISDIVTKAQTDYETSKTDFFSAKKILEDIVGFTFSNTNTKRKP